MSTVPILLAASVVLTLCITAVFLVSALDAQHLQDVPWSANVPISDPQAIPQNPAVAVDAAGQAYAAWQDARAGAARGIHVAAQPAGGTWTPPVKIPGSDAGNPGWPTIAAGAADEVFVAWVSGFPDARADIHFAWSVDSGLTWDSPVRVNIGSQDIAGHPDLAVDALGNAHLVWSDLAVFGDPHSRDIMWSVRPAGQDAWTEPAVVHPDVEVLTQQARPAIATTSVGDVYAIWEDARHGPGDASALYAARLPAGSALWEPSRRVDQRPSDTNIRPDIAAAPDGTVFAVWDAGTHGAVYSAVLRPGTGSWDGPARVNDLGAALAGWQLDAVGRAPRVAVDGRGTAYTVWQDVRNGDPDIYAAVRWPGSSKWGHNTRVNDDEGTASQETPAIAAAGAGRVVTIWMDQRRGTSGDIYIAEHMLAIFDVYLPLLSR